MSYQFIHMETYARSPNKRTGKASARSIAQEAERHPGAAPHVADPQAPRLIHGVSPGEAVAEATRRADEARDSRGRRMRRDGQIIAGIVASYPTPSADLDPDDAELQDWIRRTVEWAKTEWGDTLLSAVLHTDETHPHLHLYAVPELTAEGRMSARDVHPGIRARDAAPPGKARHQAYKTAMRELQDRYQESVGQYHGQARLGPRRRRMTRESWKAETAERERLAHQLRQAEASASALAANRAQLTRRVRQVNSRVEAYNKRLRRLQARERRLQQRTAALEGVGGRVGRVWAAVRRVPARIEAQVRGEAEERIQALQERQQAAQAELEALQQQKEADAGRIAALTRRAQGAESHNRKLRQSDSALELADSETRRAEAERDARVAQDRLREARQALEAGDLDKARILLADRRPQRQQEAPERRRDRDGGGLTLG